MEIQRVASKSNEAVLPYWSDLCHGGILYADLPLLRVSIVSTTAGNWLSEMRQVASLKFLSHELISFHVWCQRVLAEARLKVAPWNISAPLNLEAIAVGDLRSIDFAVRTRKVGYWGVNDYRRGTIYRVANGVSLQILIDPNWVTGDHAYHLLSSGHTRVCGIISVREVDHDTKVVLGVPIVLAIPVTDFGREMCPDSVHLLCRTEKHKGTEHSRIPTSSQSNSGG